MHAALLISASMLLFQDSRPAKDPAVEKIVIEIDTILKKGEPEQKIKTLKKAAEFDEKPVVQAVAKGLQDGAADVRVAAAETLGLIKNPFALDALHKYYNENRDSLKKDETVLPVLLKGIARHGKESSIDILKDDPYSQRTHATIEARILGLGNIRSLKSVEALVDLMKLWGNGKNNPYMTQFRVALTRLTGKDQGPTVAQWLEWWNEHHHDTKVSDTASEMPKALERAWNNYWDDGRDKQKKVKKDK
jgi:hypothetical protein